MSIPPSATWFDGFFIDVILVFEFPVYPKIWKDERVREYTIYHESLQSPSSLALWIHGDIILHLSLDMH
jgi:hypothetical protein